MSDHESTPLSSVIRERRRALGLSQGQLAAKVGENLIDVKHWEEGEALPTATTLEKVAKVLDVDPGDLARLVGAPDVSGELVLDGETEISGDSTVTVEVLVPETPDEADERWGEMWGEEPSGDGEREPATPGAPPGVPAGEAEAVRTDAGTPPGTAPVGAGSAPATVAQEDVPTRTAPPPQAAAPSLPVTTRSQPSVAIDPPVSYIEDPIQYRIYWLRAALLAITVIVLLSVLAWAVGELGTAISQFLDQFGTGGL